MQDLRPRRIHQTIGGRSIRKASQVLIFYLRRMKNIATKEECIAFCEKMMNDLNGEWKAKPSGPHKKMPWERTHSEWMPLISNGEVYILLNVDDGSYDAAFEGVNYEMEGWTGRTPKEALSKLVRAHKSRITSMKKRVAELNKEIPEAEVEYERMKTWLK